MLSMWHPNMDKRRKLIRKRGVNIADTAFVDLGAWIEVTTPQAVTIEDYAIIGQGSAIIAHDTGLNTFTDMPLKVQPTRIGYNAAIAPRSIIMPGVNVGDNSAVTAGSVVTKDVPEGIVVGGNPAKPIAKISDIIKLWQNDMKKNPDLYYDHPQPFRAPENPFEEFINWRNNGTKIRDYTDIKTGSPFDCLIEAGKLKKKKS
ncbi:MAG: acyltransferase [Actinobacteria bacterium]|nr:acyltransferase [Actinomycetota bacterium]